MDVDDVADGSTDVDVKTDVLFCNIADIDGIDVETRDVRSTAKNA